MANEIVWEIDYDTAELYANLALEFENREIEEEEYAERLQSLPGYPLPGLPSHLCTLRLVIKPPKPTSIIHRPN